ncbi:MAG: glycosyltransferase family 39 protein [Kiritimatiellia bacterium]
MLFDRTFHPDEANQAFTVGRLLETGAYAYRPADHHGPTLYYAAAPLQRAFGHADTAGLDGTVLRCTPLLFAVLGLVLGGLAVRRMTGSVWAALGFALLLGTAPIYVFFATDFIQEALLACFLLGMYWAAAGYLRPGGRLKPGSWALFFGVFAGLAFATKETSLLSFAAAFLAGAPFLVRAAAGRRAADSRTPPGRSWAGFDAALAAAGFALASVVLFSSFCTHWRGVLDAFVTAPLAYLGRGLGDAAASTGANWHVHPWWQYAHWLFAQAPFSELDLFVAAFAACPLFLGVLRFAFLRADAKRAHFVRFKPEKAPPSPHPPLGPWLFALLYSAILFGIYSAIPYKTPWCALQILAGVALATALGLHAVAVRLGGRFVPPLVAAGIVAGIVAFRLPALAKMNRDPDAKEIPFNYANASPEVKDLAACVAAAMAADASAAGPRAEEPAEKFVAVALPPADTWPFPWYNRPLEGRTGYWTSFEDLVTLQQSGAKPTVVIVPMAEGHLVQPLFPHLTHTRRFRIRPKVRVRVFW